LGILIAILAWLAFSRLPSGKQHRAAEERERAAGSFATLTPVLKSRNQRLSAADYRADPAGGQLEDEEQAPTVREYDQEVATEPSANSDLADDVIAGSSPYYAGADQAPVVYGSDCLVSPLDQIVAYQQPNEIIVFSNARSFRRRHRSAARFGGTRMMAHRSPNQGRNPNQGQFHARGGGSVSPRKTNARFSTKPGNHSSPKSLARK
jgi:hypothetical protein